MPNVAYGSQIIEYSIQENNALKSYYITVEKQQGVVLKGKAISSLKADQLILKKATWILGKVNLVKSITTADIVTGSRISYLGRSYYTKVLFDRNIGGAQIEFNHSQFIITVNPTADIQPVIQKALTEFYRIKSIEKITPRIKKLAQKSGLNYQDLKFMRLSKRWGSCTETNNIIINIDVIKLSFTLIDYVLVHELCHTKIKNHSKDYWVEVSKLISNWKELDKKIYDMMVI